MKTLAIDQGTTSTRALVVGADGSVTPLVSLPHRQIYPQAGFVEHDPEELLGAPASRRREPYSTLAPSASTTRARAASPGRPGPAAPSARSSSGRTAAPQPRSGGSPPTASRR